MHPRMQKEWKMKWADVEYESGEKLRVENGRIQVNKEFREQFGTAAELHLRLVLSGFRAKEATVRGWYARKWISRKDSPRIMDLIEDGKLTAKEIV